MEVTNEMRSQMIGRAIELDSSYSSHLTGICLTGLFSGLLLYNGETLPYEIAAQSGLSGLAEFTEKHITNSIDIQPGVWAFDIDPKVNMMPL
jgi:hypothetical protein